MLAICSLAGCHFSAAPAHDDAAVGLEPSPGGAGYHKVISVAGSGSATLQGFPMWVDLVDADLAAHAAADGSDIHFALPSGSKLDYEIELWDAHAGTLAAWVRVPTLDASTTIELHYGDPQAASPPNPAAVFAGYAAVWHMSDSPTATTIVDSTGRCNGSPQGLGSGSHIAGKLANAIAFTGSSDQVSFTNPITGSGPHTMSAWVQQQAPGAGEFDAVIGLGTVQTDQSRFLDSRFTSGGVAVGFFNDDYMTTTAVIGQGWTLIHWVFEGSNRRSQLYRNGELVGELVHQNLPNTTGAAGIIGNAPPGLGSGLGLPGAVDEVRITTVPLTSAWIAAEFANQSNPSSFYSVGPELSP
jgi:hypothetical protein